MSTIDLIKSRRSIRSYTDEAVPEELLNKVLEAGTYAASGMGRQSAIIIAVTDRETRDMLSKLNAAVMNSDFDPFYGAPYVFAVLADKNVRTYLYDGSLVMGNMMLAAEELGLGTCWIHRAKEEFESEEGKALLEKLGVEGEYEGIGNLIIGWPKGDKPAAKERKDNYIYRV